MIPVTASVPGSTRTCSAPRSLSRERQVVRPRLGRRRAREEAVDGVPLRVREPVLDLGHQLGQPGEPGGQPVVGHAPRPAASMPAISPMISPISRARRSSVGGRYPARDEEVLQRGPRQPRWARHPREASSTTASPTRSPSDEAGELHHRDLAPHLRRQLVRVTLDRRPHDPRHAVGADDPPRDVVPSGALAADRGPAAHQVSGQSRDVLHPDHGRDRTAVPGLGGYDGSRTQGRFTVAERRRRHPGDRRQGAELGVVLQCGGHPMVPVGSEVPAGLTTTRRSPEPTAIGKRFHDEASGIELLATKGGAGTLALDGTAIPLKDAKPLPASD